MKKAILFFIIIFFIKNTNAQGYGVPDTLAYLNTIAANKAQFIGQPFSRLRDSLKIQIKWFSPFAAIHYKKNKETSTSFGFYFSVSTDDYYLTYPRIEIYWQTNIDKNQSNIFWENNQGGWESTVANYYANAIIADIKVRE